MIQYQKNQGLYLFIELDNLTNVTSCIHTDILCSIPPCILREIVLRILHATLVDNQKPVCFLSDQLTFFRLPHHSVIFSVAVHIQRIITKQFRFLDY